MRTLFVARIRGRQLFLIGALIVGAGIAVADADRRKGQNPVLHWNRIATEIFPVDLGPVLDSRALAILHAAIHDAVNGVERRYEPYTADLSVPGASVDAAVASAARDVIVALAPSQRERIERDFAVALAKIPDGPAEDQGVALGQEAARLNLDRRSQDGVVPGPLQDGPVTEPVYAPTGKPGDYDFTPPFDAPPLGPIALFPGWGRLAPFVIDVAHHRVPGPDPLDSKRYARDFNIVKFFGSLHSSTRKRDQAETAFFWFEGLGIWNDIARGVLKRHDIEPWRAARVLALMNFALADGVIANFDGKYHFRFWRPYTAIRRAGEDGNDRTEADPEWLPLLWTPPGMPPTFLIPPVPDYPSAAATTSAAAAELLAAHLGDSVRFKATSPTAPGVTRRFRSFAEAANESGMSRVYGGIHFVHAVEDGLKQGKSIGRDVSRMLPRVRR